ncbi:MAG: hypothetical protein ACE5F1_15190, partial [Planctomycetota bacterium]
RMERREWTARRRRNTGRTCGGICRTFSTARSRVATTRRRSGGCTSPRGAARKRLLRLSPGPLGIPTLEATTLLALWTARETGLPVPEHMIEGALAELARRTDDESGLCQNIPSKDSKTDDRTATAVRVVMQ